VHLPRPRRRCGSTSGHFERPSRSSDSGAVGVAIDKRTLGNPLRDFRVRRRRRRSCQRSTNCRATRGRRLRCSRPLIGEWAAQLASDPLAGRDSHSIPSWASVSVGTPAASFWGAARLAGRRSRACKCSRDRRVSGSDSEARDRRAVLPRRHQRGVDDWLTQTPLRRACQLRKPCSLPYRSCQPGITGTRPGHSDQSCDSRRSIA
jgi:hypothetical protein